MQINGQLHAFATLPSYTLDGPTTGLDDVGEEKNYCLCRGSIIQDISNYEV
jgi:hypothetical protein